MLFLDVCCLKIPIAFTDFDNGFFFPFVSQHYSRLVRTVFVVTPKKGLYKLALCSTLLC